MSVISSNVDQGDTRFWKAIDDPKGDDSNPPSKVISIPIALKEEENQSEFHFPKGVTIAVNKIGEGDFLPQDIEAVKAYNCLVARVIDIAA